MSNFIPNEQKTFRPSEPPWLTKNIKAYLRKHNKIYRKFKQSGFNDVERVQVEQSKSKINDLILDAKEKYLQSQGAELADPSTGSKKYWKILNSFLNKCKVPRIPHFMKIGVLLQIAKKKRPYLITTLQNSALLF